MEDKIITLNLTVKQVNIVLAHLSNGIFKDVAETINLVTAQGNPQMAAYQKAMQPASEKNPAEEPVQEAAPEEAKPEVVN